MIEPKIKKKSKRAKKALKSLPNGISQQNLKEDISEPEEQPQAMAIEGDCFVEQQLEIQPLSELNTEEIPMKNNIILSEHSGTEINKAEIINDLKQDILEQDTPEQSQLIRIIGDENHPLLDSKFSAEQQLEIQPLSELNTEEIPIKNNIILSELSGTEINKAEIINDLKQGILEQDTSEQSELIRIIGDEIHPLLDSNFSAEKQLEASPELITEEISLKNNILLPDSSDTETHSARLILAKKIVRDCMCYSSSTAIVPIPMVDMLAGFGIQLVMLQQLCKLYDIPFSKEKGKAIISSIIAGTNMSLIAMSFSKIVPIIGLTISVASMAALSSAITYAVGMIFIQHFESGGTFLNFDRNKLKEARKQFEMYYHKGKTIAEPIN
ncbi:MAG: YcjF family protein [Desulfobacterales bacterium]|nr:YcjF family protein [Desulfobacterales bacterium]